MSSARRSPTRERRIVDEVIVDAYTESERAMSWYYYLDNQLRFPFPARCITVRSISPLKRGGQVIVIGMAPEEECMQEVLVRMRWGKRSRTVPLIQLDPREADRATRQAVEDWRYWVGQGFVF